MTQLHPNNRSNNEHNDRYYLKDHNKEKRRHIFVHLPNLLQKKVVVRFRYLQLGQKVRRTLCFEHKVVGESRAGEFKIYELKKYQEMSIWSFS